MNHIEMSHVCTGCDKDCETAWGDGSCALAGDAKEPHSATNDSVPES